MNKTTHLDRRSFLYGQVAVASTIGLSGASYARGRTNPRWETATARQFEAFIGQAFTGMDKDRNLLHLTLVKVESGNSGSDRPKNLPRPESVILVFKSDFAEDLAAQGHHSVWINHHTLGETNIFLGAVPRRSGGYDIEAILN